MVQGGRWQRARRVPSRGCNIWAECCRAGARGVSSGCCAIWYELRADRYEARKGELSPSLQIVQATASIYERGSVSVTALAAVPLATGERVKNSLLGLLERERTGERDTIFARSLKAAPFIGAPVTTLGGALRLKSPFLSSHSHHIITRMPVPPPPRLRDYKQQRRTLTPIGTLPPLSKLAVPTALPSPKFTPSAGASRWTPRLRPPPSAASRASRSPCCDGAARRTESPGPSPCSRRSWRGAT